MASLTLLSGLFLSNLLNPLISKSRPLILLSLPINIINLSSEEILNFSLNLPYSGRLSYSFRSIPRGTISMFLLETPIFKYCNFSVSVRAKTLFASYNILNPQVLSNIFLSFSF